LQSEKLSSQTTPTDAGRQMDFNDEQQENVFAPIRVTVDLDSTVNDESESHPWKHSSPIIRTLAGRQTDCNDEQL
jgi:hypothetical protein